MRRWEGNERDGGEIGVREGKEGDKRVSKEGDGGR